MNACGTSRLLVPGFMVGLGVSTFTGNDLFGWIAAALTIGVLAVLQKVRGAAVSCALPPSSDSVSRTVADRDIDPDQPASRSN
jgi:hypothetical protein